MLPSQNPNPMCNRNVLTGCLIATIFLIAGCSEDTAIRSYSVAKKPAAPVASEQSSPAQMLGVIVPHRENAWFFKMTDKPEKVQRLADEFRQLAGSLSFSDDGTPQWQLAPGWTEKVLKQITYATFSSADGATVTLTQLGANTNDSQQWQTYLTDNINRWRQQLSLEPQEWSVMQPQLEEVAKHSTEKAKAYFVSLTGKQTSGGQRGMRAPFLEQMGAGAGASATRPQPTGLVKLTYQVPDGWQEKSVTGIRLAAFEIADTPSPGTVVVSTASGAIESSVGMWLQQIGATAGEQQVNQVIESATEGTAQQTTYRCYTVAQEDKEQAIRVAVIPLGPSGNIYVKLTGSRQLMQSQIEKMDQFLSSLSW